MFWALAVILLAFAGFSVLVLRLPERPAAQGAASSALGDREQLRGFVYVGAAGLALLALVVVVIGQWTDRADRAEAIAVLGLFAYLAYLGSAAAVLYVGSRR